MAPRDGEQEENMADHPEATATGPQRHVTLLCHCERWLIMNKTFINLTVLKAGSIQRRLTPPLYSISASFHMVFPEQGHGILFFPDNYPRLSCYTLPWQKTEKQGEREGLSQHHLGRWIYPPPHSQPPQNVPLLNTVTLRSNFYANFGRDLQ